MSTLIWFIIIVGLIVASPYIARWVSRLVQEWVARKIRNKMREAMGMPPESKEERRAQREQFRQQQEEAAYARRRRRSSDPTFSLRRILHSYAVDIEFTEIREYSTRTEIHPEAGGARVIIENQVTDAEYILLRPGGPTDFEPKSKKGFWRRNK